MSKYENAITNVDLAILLGVPTNITLTMVYPRKDGSTMTGYIHPEPYSLESVQSRWLSGDSLIIISKEELEATRHTVANKAATHATLWTALIMTVLFFIALWRSRKWN